MEQTYCKGHIDMATDVAALKEHSRNINGSIARIDSNIENIYGQLDRYKWWLIGILSTAVLQLLLFIGAMILK